MTKMTASTFVGNGSLSLYLDNVLIASNSDSISVNLEENREYIVHWYVSGADGGSYSVSISSPRQAEFQLTRRMGASGKDIGSVRFAV
jgi:hypothetical protein